MSNRPHPGLPRRSRNRTSGVAGSKTYRVPHKPRPGAVAGSHRNMPAASTSRRRRPTVLGDTPIAPAASASETMHSGESPARRLRN